MFSVITIFTHKFNLPVDRVDQPPSQKLQLGWRMAVYQLAQVSSLLVLFESRKKAGDDSWKT